MAWTWTRALALVAAIVYLTWIGLGSWDGLVRFQPLGIDLMPMWAAGHEVLRHPHWVYDVDRLTDFERPMLWRFHGPRPFVYPPSSLLLFAPLGFLPFAAAYVVITLTGLAAILGVTARLAPRPLLLVAMLVTPASVLVVNTGQVTFLIAAMTVAALASLERRPIVAGVLFGVVGVIKPEAMVLLPVALIAARQLRATWATALTAALALFVTLAAFGLDIWVRWFHAMDHFSTWVMAAWDLERGMITPTALGKNLNLDPASFDVWRLGFDVGAAVMAAWVFRRTGDLARRTAALLGGSLFITPYAMHSDAALLAPAAVLMLARRPSPGPWIIAFIAAVLLCCCTVPHWGAAAVTAFTLIASLTPAGILAGRRSLNPYRPPLPSAGPELEGVDRA
jgi:hypothetical protein